MKPPSPPSPAGIASLAAALLPASDYALGLGNREIPLPHNVLCFTRLTVLSLGQSPFRSHHSRYVFIAALQGSGRVCVDDALYLLKPGEGLLIPPFAFHAYTDMEAEIVWAFTTFDAPGGSYEALSRGGARRFGEDETRLLRQVLECWNRRDEGIPLPLGLLLMRLAASSPAGDRRPRLGLPVAEGELLRAINRYLLPRLAEPVGVPEVAQALGQSESHLRARFRRLTGTSLGWHLRDLRLQRASLLLHTTLLPVGEIALQCGFGSLYAFSRAFRSVRGVSPRDYRRMGEEWMREVPPGTRK